MIMIQRIAIAGLGFAFLSAALPAMADSVPLTSPLSDRELASQRGGFSLDNLEISIGLEQVISVNGEALAVNRLTIPNLNQVISGKVVPHQMERVFGILNSGQDGRTLVSNTSGDGGWMTLIQNDLNGSVIQNARQLNIELNNLGAGYRIPDNLREPILQFLGR